MSHPDARTLDSAAQEHLRFQAVRLREEGRPLTEVAQICGVAPTTVSVWHTRFRQQGPEALRRRKRGRRFGTQRRLSAAQERKLQRWIVHKTPEQLRFPFMLWTRRVVAALIEREFGISLSLPTVGRYLARWGLTAQRPLKRALEQDPDATRQWLTTTYPQIKARAKAQGAVIYWGDETGLRSDSAFGRGFAPAGQTPVATLPARRVRAEVISAVSNQGALRFMIYDGGMNAPLFIRFLQRLIKDADQKVFLIVDNLRVHHARKVRAWVARHPDAIELFYLPPYSPELNPDEYLNGDLKGRIHRGLPHTKQHALKRALLSALRSIQRQNGHVRSYFRHPKVQYAAT
jgi:transposase